MRILGISLVLAALFAACSTQPQASSLNAGEEAGSCSHLEGRILTLEAQIQQTKAGKDAVLDPYNTGFALASPASDSSAATQIATGAAEGSTTSSAWDTQESGSTATSVIPVQSTAPITSVKPVTSGAASSNTGAQAGNSVLASLESRLAAAKAELQKCNASKFGESKLPGPTAGNQGHCDYKGQPYDILNYNCHSAANESVRDEPKVTGIVSCNGLAPFKGSPAHHTFNYRVEGSSIVYYNWGKTCVAPKGSIPPDLLDLDHLRCAQTFCGDQYKPETAQAFEPGKLVEEPGPLFCASHPAVANATQCDSCCRFRGTYWDKIPSDLRPSDATFIGFSSQCFSACSAKFPAFR